MRAMYENAKLLIALKTLVFLLFVFMGKKRD